MSDPVNGTLTADLGEQLAIEAIHDHLAALAGAAAETLLAALLTTRAHYERTGPWRLPPDDPALIAGQQAGGELSVAWWRFARSCAPTQRERAMEVVLDAALETGGEIVAAAVEAAMLRAEELALAEIDQECRAEARAAARKAYEWIMLDERVAGLQGALEALSLACAENEKGGEPGQAVRRALEGVGTAVACALKNGVDLEHLQAALDRWREWTGGLSVSLVVQGEIGQPQIIVTPARPRDRM